MRSSNQARAKRIERGITMEDQLMIYVNRAGRVVLFISDLFGLGDELSPSIAGGVYDGVVVLEDGV